MTYPVNVIKPRTKARGAHARFITKGLWKTETPAALVERFREADFQDGETQRLGELARLYRGRARITIQTNGYCFPGGASGDATELLDAWRGGAA